MDVILLQKVANLGAIGDRVKVKSGYGRNYLLPSGRATLATAANVARFEARRAELEQLAGEHLGGAQQRADYQLGDHADHDFGHRGRNSQPDRQQCCQQREAEP